MPTRSFGGRSVPAVCRVESSRVGLSLVLNFEFEFSFEFEFES